MTELAPVLRLGSGAIGVAVVPRLGGRMLSFRFHDEELLWRNPALLDERLRPRVPLDEPGPSATFAHWQNWGGDKSWPAPQGWQGEGQWPGPPDAVLDAGPYEVRERTSSRVTLESAPDERTGLTVRRTIECGADDLVVETRIRNTGSRDVRWSAWEVAQFLVTERDARSPGTGVYVEIDRRRAGDPVRTIFSPHGRIATAVAEGLVHVPFPDAVGKLGFPTADGRVRLVREHLLVDISFPVEPEAQYPNDSPFQLWTQLPLSEPLDGFEGLQPDARLVELEPLSPLRGLAPGESASLRVVWRPQER